MGDWGWGLVGLVVMGLFVAWLGPVYGFVSMVGTCLLLGTIFRVLNRRAERKQTGSSTHTPGTQRQPVTSRDVAAFLEKTFGESVAELVEDKNEFYRTCLHPFTNRDKVISALLNLYALKWAVESVWPDETMREWRHAFLDDAHTAVFTVLRSKKLVDDAQSLKASAVEYYSRWDKARTKGAESGPSDIYWVAKEALITLRPDQDPDLAMIDAFQENFFRTTIVWVDTLKALRKELGLGELKA
jgi:hypothetical protein